LSDDNSYQQGYADGAWDVIQAVRGKLDATEHVKLDAWFGSLSREWRLSEPPRSRRMGA